MDRDTGYWRRNMALWRLVPTDHYTALGLEYDADEASIRQAYEEMLVQVSSSWWRRVWAQICGESPARLLLARDELLDPAKRVDYDRHMEMLRKFFSYPPQT